MLYIGKQLLHHLIDIGIGLDEARIGFHSLYFLDCFDGFSAVSYTHLDVYKRQVSSFGTSPLISKGILYSLTALRAKTLNAVVIVIPISAQNLSLIHI